MCQFETTQQSSMPRAIHLKISLPSWMAPSCSQNSMLHLGFGKFPWMNQVNSWQHSWVLMGDLHSAGCHLAKLRASNRLRVGQRKPLGWSALRRRLARLTAVHESSRRHSPIGCICEGVPLMSYLIEQTCRLPLLIHTNFSKTRTICCERTRVWRGAWRSVLKGRTVYSWQRKRAKSKLCRLLQMHNSWR